MITETLKEIAATRAKLAELESTRAAELKKELASLPGKYGFDSARSFIKAFRAAGGARSHVGKSRRRKGRRAKITETTRAEVKKLLSENKTGAEIAAAVGISLPSVQNIKKTLGLVRKRKK